MDKDAIGPAAGLEISCPGGVCLRLSAEISVVCQMGRGRPVGQRIRPLIAQYSGRDYAICATAITLGSFRSAAIKLAC